MLEKIGLPSKPSLRGNNWVVDASHCQGCSSQFTFINRKHHCRRCGGLFCNSCTQQRMVLRGQGDSPVRICEPCKKLEEAARFEMRHGLKNKAGRGGSKLMSKQEDELLNEIMDNDRRESVLSGRESVVNMVSNIQQATSSASSSNIQEATNQDDNRKVRSLSIDGHNNALTDMGSTTPEELRQEALDQKKKYKILKAEGKSEEALKAFKRGKELERQAGALELHLRKNRKRTLSSNNMTELQKINDDSKELGRKTKLPQKNTEKDGLASELRELGWSDMDLHDADKRPRGMSLEGELSKLLGEVSQKVNSAKGTYGIEKSQVIAHKKKALALKREGKLDEAKEELKRAKVLEKQIEEQELLGDAEDSDEEFSSLMHSMDIDKQDDLLSRNDVVPSFDFNNLVDAADDLAVDGNFDVTDEDMDDPELAATLKSLGWTDETTQSEDIGSHLNKEALLNEIQSLKREAIYQKRAGNTEEAVELLKKAKLLERDLDSSASEGTNLMEHSAEKPLKIIPSDVGNVYERKDMAPRPASKNKLMIQKELLGLKKRAFALRREGRLDEADEELKKGKILEQQLEEMDKASKTRVSLGDGGNKNADDSTALDVEDDGDVTDQDMQDPTYLSVLRNLGWKDEDNECVPHSPFRENDGNANDVKINNSSVSGVVSGNQVGQSRSKGEIQRELLALKRKSLTLRRQGAADEAEEVLKMARLLEIQLAEVEAPKRQAVPAEFNRQTKHDSINFSLVNSVDEGDEGVLSEEDMHDPALLSMLKNLGWKDEEAVNVQAKSSEQTSRNPVSSDDILLTPFSPELQIAAQKRSKMEIQRELLGLKRKALTLRRQGETEEAEEVLRMTKALEAQLEEVQVPKTLPLSDGSKNQECKTGSVSPDENQGCLKDVLEVNDRTVQATVEANKAVEQPEGLGGRESEKAKFPFKTSDISVPETSQLIDLSHQLLVDLDPPREIRSAESTGLIAPSGQSANIMDLLTGESWSSSQSDQNMEQKWDVSSVNSFSADFHVPRDSQKAYPVDFRNKDEEVTDKGKEEFVANEKPHINKLNPAQVTVSQNDGSSIQQDIVAHKRKAVALKREGKLAEAKEELRQAKVLEKHLENSNLQSMPSASDVSSSNAASVGEQQHGLSSAAKQLSTRKRFKLQQESLNHKRQALKLRREGRIEEAEAEFELAKSLETQLEDPIADESVADVTVEDFLDPQLLSALKAIGLEDNSIVPQNTRRPVSVPATVAKAENLTEERIQLEERIKAEKVKAVNLKRSGKQAEALEALRHAKLLEKKLNSLAAQ